MTAAGVRRITVPLLACVLGLGFLLTLARPAGANTEATVTVKVGQTVKLTLNDLSGDDATGTAENEAGSDTSGVTPPGQDAAGCEGPPPNPSCDDVPITLAVPQSELKPNNELFLQTVISYNPGSRTSTPTGVYQNQNQITGWLWENPVPSTGPNAGTYDATCANEPCEEGAASPQVAHFDLVIDQEVGSTDPVSVVISLLDVASGASSSGSGSSGGTSAGGGSFPGGGSGGGANASAGSGSGASSGSSGAPTGSGPAPAAEPSAPIPSATPSTLPTFSSDSQGPSSVLASLANTDFGSELGIGGAQSLRTGQFFGTPPARPASGVAVALSLLVGPLMLVALLASLAYRRRGQLV